MPEKTATALVGHIEPADGPALSDNEVVTDRQARCAVSVVRELLERTGVAPLLHARNLGVMVGDGNWISFGFRLKPGAEQELGALKSLRPAQGKNLRGEPPQSKWFRSSGRPSLHFEIVSTKTPGEILVRGHVDAADPLGHPVAHLIRDYLPAHGIGTHPSPEALLALLGSNPLPEA